MAALAYLFLFLLLLSANSRENCSPVIPISRSVPAVYVFGDSTVDAGNNNYIDDSPKVNFLPYGIDFNNTPTGRFTNGKTTADFIAVFHNLSLPLPHLSLTDAQKKTTMGGLNYASAGCGIMDGTRPPVVKKDCLSLPQQVNAFHMHVRNDLPSMIKDPQELAKYLANSIYFISTGTNDYVFRFAQGLRTDPISLATLLLGQLRNNMATLYGYGARNFLVNNIAPLGCLPSMVYGTGTIGQCNEEINLYIMPYINMLPQTLRSFQSDFSDANITLANSHGLIYDILRDPSIYGFTNVEEPCCALYDNGQIYCPLDFTTCDNRDDHLFFDDSHSSQYANCIFVKILLSEV